MITFAEGGPCERGETAAKTGCTPAGGGGGKTFPKDAGEAAGLSIPDWATTESEVAEELKEAGADLGLPLSEYSVGHKPGGGSIGKHHSTPFPLTSAKYLRKALGKELTPERADQFVGKAVEIAQSVMDPDSEEYDWPLGDIQRTAQYRKGLVRGSIESHLMESAINAITQTYEEQKPGAGDYGASVALRVLKGIMT
tara:strand:- start:473 stop:1063 length:591 start_codon:yes stop_codon:yes gene_type:complete